jgi:hypothetical protein
MTQRGPKLRQKVAAMRHTARALTTATALLLASVSMRAEAPAMTRTRTVKPRHEIAQPVSLHAYAKAVGHEKHSAARTSSFAVSHKKLESPRHGGKMLRAAVWPKPQASQGRGHGRRAELSRTEFRQPASREIAAMRHPVQARREQEAAWRGIAEHKARTGVVPRAAGGELTIDQFMQVANASAEGVPMVTAPGTHTPAPIQRVDGFGAEGAVLSAPAPSEPLPDAGSNAAIAVLGAGAITGDSRVRALVQPSHQEVAEELSAPIVLPGLYRNGRLVVPAPMKGSHDILVHQNTMANDEGLERIRDEDDLERLRATRQLVDFPESASLRVNPELGSDRRCARVWTVKFAQDMARAYYSRFREPLQVNSAARTVAYQLRLQRTNGNAAGISGETSSPHLTGQAIDFGKHGMSVEQIAWMRAYLKPLMDAGKVDVEEEFQQACFHISVYKSYLPMAPALRHLQVAATVRMPSDHE